MLIQLIGWENLQSKQPGGQRGVGSGQSYFQKKSLIKKNIHSLYKNVAIDATFLTGQLEYNIRLSFANLKNLRMKY